MKSNLFILNILFLLVFISCNGSNATKVDIEIKQPRPLNTTLDSVNVVNDKIIIRGTGFESVTKVQISGNGSTGTYAVESSTANEIIVYAASAAMIGIGKTLDLIIGNAEAQAGYQISFDLDDRSVTSQKIHPMGASTGQVLKFNGTDWVPASLPNSQLYLGSFDAQNNLPDLSTPSSTAGDYYIVSEAGSFNGITYAIGDWIISDGVAWQKIANTQPMVHSFEGRTGAVVLVPGDYVSLKDTTTHKLTGSSLADIADIDMTGLAANKILKFDGTNWMVADDIVGGGAGSVGTTELQNSSVTYQKMNLLDGEVPMVKVSGLTTAINNLNTAVAGKISLSSLSATAPLNYNNATGEFTLIGATTTDAGSMSAADKSKLDGLEALSAGDGILERFSGVLRSNTCNANEVLKWNAVAGWTCASDSATDTTKLPLAGGTMTGNLVLNNDLSFKDGASANYVTIKAPASGTSSYTLTLPSSVGANNQVLTTNASGVLAWSTPSTTGTPVGTAGGDLSGTYPNPVIGAGKITDAHVSGAAAIAQSKINNLTTDLSTINTTLATKIALTHLSATAPLIYDSTTGAFTINASSNSVAGSMSADDKAKLDQASNSEISYLSGVSSNIQTQLNDKLDESGGTLSGNLVVNTEIQLKDGASANYVTLKAPATGTSSYTMTFPASLGVNGQVLTTNASGVLSWSTVATSSTPVAGDLSGTISNATINGDAITSAKIADGAIVNADINASAAIAQSKIANLTTDLSTMNTTIGGKIGLTDLSAAAPLVYNNTTGAFTINAATTSLPGSLSAADKTKLDSVSATELGYFSGVSAPIQTQLDNKLAESGGVLTGDLTLETQLKLKDGASANYVNLRAPATGTSSYTLTFPATVGSANQVLTTSASGVLSWSTVATSSTAVGGDLTGSIASASIASDAVTSSKIADGAIVNADINASAAIAQSKIANLTTDLSIINTNIAGKIDLTALSAASPLVYNNTTGAFTVDAATTTTPGSLSAADKTKLNALEALSAGNGMFERFSGSIRSNSCSANEVLKWSVVAGWTCATDNATDVTKLPLAGGTLTGNLIVETEIQLKDGASANYVTLRAPASGTTSYALTFPAAVGTNGQVLTTNASGVLSWSTVATSSTSVGGDLTGTISSATIAGDAVTSAKIADGAIVNADINATAAIAQSKIANLTADLSTITTNVAGKIGLTALSAAAPLVYNNTTGAFSVDAATSLLPGSMSAADKTKLDSVSASELGYVAGVTSSLQGQLDDKLSEAGGSVTGDLTLESQLKLKDGASANYVNLRAPATGTTSYTLTFPAAVGTNGQALTTNASGVLAWSTVATSSTAVGGDLNGTISSATIAGDAINSAKIADGAIVNADINASAAIDQSKIANLTTDLSTITTNVAGKIGLTALSATAPLVYNNTTGAFSVDAATTTTPGSLSAADKTKINTLEALSAGNGMFERFSGSIRSNTCSANEVLKWNVVAGWSCATDNATDATKLPLAGGTLTGNLIVDAEIQLKDGASANYVTLKAPASGTTSYTLTFPAAVGSANQVLTTNASGVLSWTTVATSSTSVGGDLTGTISSATIAGDAVTSTKIADGSIVNADINATAAIAQTKIANLTTDLSTITTNVAGKIGLTALSATAPLAYNNTTGDFTVNPATSALPGSMSATDKTKLDSVSAAELGYVSGVSSAIQGQIDGKLAEVGGTVTGDLSLETQLKLKDGASANYVNLRAPASGTSTYTLTFPGAVGANGQVLTTNASGVLSWTSIGTSTAVGGDLTGTVSSATIAGDAVTSAKIADGAIVNADINAAAAIAQSKIADLTTDLSTMNTTIAGKIGLTALSASAPLVYNNTTGAFTVNAATSALPGTMSASDKTKLDSVSAVELGYVSGVTSALQGQVNSKLANAGGTLTGDLTLNTQLRLRDGAAADYVTLKAPASGTTSYTLTFPAAVGSANQVLTTNATGVLSWTTIGTSTSIGGDLTGTVAAATIAGDAVTSAKIADGAIVNADINAAAAIAQSKIANLTTDLSTITTNVSGKIGLNALSATAPLVYNNGTGAFTVDAATTTTSGILSAADKTKLNGLEALSAGNGLFERFSGSIRSNTCSAGEVLYWNAVTGWTCDAIQNRTIATISPINTAMANGDTILSALNKAQGQIDVKSNIASPTFTGTPAAPTAASGTNTTQLATTAFVATATPSITFITANVANSTTTIADVTGLSFPVVANVTYEYEFFIVYSAAATSTGSRWSINGPAATFVHFETANSLTATAMTFNTGLQAYNVPASGNATSLTTGNIATIKGIVRPSAAGTVTARFASEIGASAITAQANKCYVKWKAIAN